MEIVRAPRARRAGEPGGAVERAQRASQGEAGFAELGYATVDTSRGARTGAGEVVFGAGKTAEQIAGICRALLESGQPRVLVTRLSAEKARQTADLLAEMGEPRLTYHERASLAFVGAELEEATGNGTICVVSAGTSDEPVAEEAALTAEFLGNRVERVFDVGVAGIHRLMAHTPTLERCQVAIVVAGMEGALASVVAGLIAAPVIAVPTSVGYGSAFEGITALLAMMSSCASGVSVVGIDNGFGAGFQASAINHLPGKGEERS